MCLEIYPFCFRMERLQKNSQCIITEGSASSKTGDAYESNGNFSSTVMAIYKCYCRTTELQIN